MRWWPIIALTLAAGLGAAESTPAHAYPLWDGVESVADYGRRVDLPPQKTLDLGNGVKLDLVLIPAGKFLMGTSEPPPVDEYLYTEKYLTGVGVFGAGVSALSVALVVLMYRAVRLRERPKLSLARLLVMTLLAGIAVLGYMHMRAAQAARIAADVEYAAAETRFKSALDSEKPAHSVTLTRPFYFGTFTVTQDQYLAVVGEDPSHFKGKDHPVESVSWDESVAFCRKLSAQLKQTVRLPTEAEWEFACRAGTTTRYYLGDEPEDLDRVAWHGNNSGRKTHPVGQKEPNVFGLYDMIGNVCEWCHDFQQNDYYEVSEPEDPQGPEPNAFAHIQRGNGCCSHPGFCTVSSRATGTPFVMPECSGFRIVVEP